MSVSTTNSSASPFFFHSSPGLFTHLLEPQDSQCVPGTPPPETLHPSVATLSLQRALGGAHVSPLGQTVPVSVQRSGGHVQESSSAGVAYSGSPLLRQILRSGRKRQRDDSPDAASPSPTVMSSKRSFREAPGTPTNLVVLRRSTSVVPKHKRGDEECQVVPGSPLPCVVPTLKVQGDIKKCKKESTEETADREKTDNDFKWFDFFLGDSSGNKLMQHEE